MVMGIPGHYIEDVTLSNIRIYYRGGGTKDALNREASMDLASALEAEAQIQAALMVHPDFRESYDAFVEKREARFL